MIIQTEHLGKVSVTVEKDYHNINKCYDKLTIVEEENEFRTYISRKPVPNGIELTNRNYWIPFSSLERQIVIDYNKFKNDVLFFIVSFYYPPILILENLPFYIIGILLDNL